MSEYKEKKQSIEKKMSEYEQKMSEYKEKKQSIEKKMSEYGVKQLQIQNMKFREFENECFKVKRGN